MRIGIQTWGSEGDIRPFLALGHALARRGHIVELAYTEIQDRRYEAVAGALGFTARAVASPVLRDPQQMVDLGLRILSTPNPLTQGLLVSRLLLEPIIEPAYAAALDLCQRSDIVIQHFMLHGARAAADRTGTPLVTVAFAHMLAPSRYLHPAGMPHFGMWGDVLFWKIASVALNQTLLKDVNRFRAKVGLPRFGDLLRDAWASHRLNLLASSPALLDRPPDWPSWNQMCGFLELPAHEHETVSPDVERFLSAGAAPVFMGFGSLMPVGGTGHLEETIQIFEEAARLAGVRAIIQSELERPAGDDVLYIRRTPHRLVFPRCAAVVHHAGAGTTHSTLRAGVPSIPVPHVSDQFAWAEELHRLGAAPAAIRRMSLTAAALASRITEVLETPSMKRSAVSMRERMADDNGPEAAANLVESSVA